MTSPIVFTIDNLSNPDCGLQQTPLVKRWTDAALAYGCDQTGTDGRFRVPGERGRDDVPDELATSGAAIGTPLPRLVDYMTILNLKYWAVATGITSAFPGTLTDLEPEGALVRKHTDAIVAVAAARAAQRKNDDASDYEAPLPREVPCRSFLERTPHEAIQLKRPIFAMMAESEAACGASQILLRPRNKCHRFFRSLPDPTRLGYSQLREAELQRKYEGDLAAFYHYVSEKHCGELIQEVASRDLMMEATHPHTSCFSEEDGEALELVPEVHSAKVFGPELDPQIVAEATHMFTDKWWRA